MAGPSEARRFDAVNTALDYQDAMRILVIDSEARAKGGRCWTYDAVSIGFPGAVMHGRPVSEPRNLGTGWVGSGFARAFGCPAKVVNDAAMQALGSFKGGRLLFLGLGTGIGSALIIDGTLEPMELAHLPCKKQRTYEEYVAQAGLKRLGKRNGGVTSPNVVIRLKAALQVTDVGGGRRQRQTPSYAAGESPARIERARIRRWISPVEEPLNLLVAAGPESPRRRPGKDRVDIVGAA